MHKIFIEYKIILRDREMYLRYMRCKQNNQPEFEFLESIEQTGLFLEIWTLPAVTNQECATRIDPHVAKWIEGGIDKLRIWHFETR